MTKLLIIVMAIAVVLVASCGGPPKSVEEKQVEDQIKGAPDWYWNPPEAEDHLYAAATAVSKDLQISVNKAETEGRSKLASIIEAKLELLVRSFAEEVGLAEDADFRAQYTQTIKSITSIVIKGSRIKEQMVMPDGSTFRAYVLMDQMLGDAYLAFYKSIKANDNLYTRFRAAEAFKEHEKEMEKYEQWKKEHELP